MKYEDVERDLENSIIHLDKRNLSFTNDFKSSKYTIYNIKTPQLKTIFPETFNEFSTQQQFDMCVLLIKSSTISEVVTWAFYYIENFSNQFLLTNKKELLLLSYSIENWWHADHLSKIYARMLDRQKLLLKDFQYWAKHGNQWQKRLSLTSLLFYANYPQNPLQADTLLSQIEMLIDDTHYYVQKGLGWSLRETYKLYPQNTFEFMRVYAKQISTVAFSQAIEKLSEEEKNSLKYLRKKGVSNPYYFEHI